MTAFDSSSNMPFAQGDERPLAWWTGRQLDALCAPFTQAWSGWKRDWIRDAADGDAGALHAHERSDHARTSWVPLGTRGEAAAWIQTRVDPVSDIFETLFAAEANPAAGPAGDGGIGQAVASRAWTALATELRGVLALDADTSQGAPDGAFFKPWSGCVAVSLPAAGRAHRVLLLNAACVRAVLGPRAQASAADRPRKTNAALVSLAHALAGRKLPLRIELSSCELDLGTLESLRIGDIVPLAHSLEAPLMVSTLQDVHVCTGFLGRHGGFKAIELAREAPADRETTIDHDF